MMLFYLLSDVTHYRANQLSVTSALDSEITVRYACVAGVIIYKKATQRIKRYVAKHP